MPAWPRVRRPPEAAVFQEAHHVMPAAWVVPVLALGGALHRDAVIGLGDRPRVVRNGQTRRLFLRIDADDVSGGAVQVRFPP